MDTIANKNTKDQEQSWLLSALKRIKRRIEG
jgi:hypothetical protein